ncbi:hypothetical protein [Nonomuraea endophytica]|uniref:Uncharacterized protein n=1 Tax=Nonomuraea endophytica TaxID=714136 RepID=A0A7W8AI39_9ACTN|nr:hypothetical protein [Nonomuraea endophytica]MBB5085278.1 hypothetical protein [Nonomuraea endophytica]
MAFDAYLWLATHIAVLTGQLGQGALVHVEQERLGYAVALAGPDCGLTEPGATANTALRVVSEDP